MPLKNNTIINEIDTFPADSIVDLKMKITHERMHQLQQKDPFCKRIMDQLEASKLPPGNLYYIKGELFMINVMDNKQHFQTIVLPQVLVAQVLRLACNELGHNGYTRMYMIICRLHYWKDLKVSVNKYVKQCLICQKRNLQFISIQFISMDIISPFDLSGNEHHYALTVIFMLTRYTFCLCLKTDSATE